MSDFKHWLEKNKEHIFEDVVLEKRNKWDPFDLGISKGFGISLEQGLETGKIDPDETIARLIAGKYLFTPFKAAYSRKKGHEFRNFSKPTAQDNVVILIMKKYMKENLIENYPEFRDYLFPDFKRNIRELRKLIIDDKNKYAMKLDISKFFDSIDKDVLRDKLKDVFESQELLIKMLNRYLSTPTIHMATKGSPRKERNWEREFRNIKDKDDAWIKIGISTGTPISNILSGIYMVEFDKMMNAKYGEKYFRYYDDILVVSDKRAEVKKFPKDILDKIEALGLKKNKTKSEPDLDMDKDGINYLGVTFKVGRTILNPSVFNGFRRKLSAIFNGGIQFCRKDNTAFAAKYLQENLNRRITNTSALSYLSYFALAPYDDNKKELGSIQGFLDHRMEAFKKQFKIYEPIKLEGLCKWVNYLHYRPKKAKEASEPFQKRDYIKLNIADLFETTLPYPTDAALDKIIDQIDTKMNVPDLGNDIKAAYAAIPFAHGKLTQRLSRLKYGNLSIIHITLKKIGKETDLKDLDRRWQELFLNRVYKHEVYLHRQKYDKKKESGDYGSVGH